MNKLFFAALFAISVVACNSTAATPQVPTPNAGAASTPLNVGLANSEHVVGANRFALGVVRDGKAVKNARVHLKFFDLTTGDQIEKEETDAVFTGDNSGEVGLYIAHANLDKAGTWGVETTVAQDGFAPDVKRIGFQVLAQDPTPAIGADAPRSKNPTLKDVNGDRSKISSATEDDSILHRLSIADAVTNGKPSVILFATPGYCTSKMCGPSHQVVMALAQNYADRVNFVHVEVYKDFETFTPADAMVEWNLTTEPWLFFVDKNGKIAEKFESAITTQETVPEFLKFIGTE